MAYRKSQSGPCKLNFFDQKSAEEPGICKSLEKDGIEVGLCENKPKNRAHHYCKDCYEIIASQDGRDATTTWPPMRDGKESRYCYDYRTENMFLIPASWMEMYDNTTNNSGNAIEIKYRKHHSKKGGNYPCYVYAIRLNDGMCYIGQTKNIDQRIHQHKNNPGKTIKKHGGYKHLIKQTKVNNRDTAEQLEQFSVELLRECGQRATHGFVDDD
jgi:predicted GIY-YIG superfamily endonuclease